MVDELLRAGSAAATARVGLMARVGLGGWTPHDLAVGKGHTEVAERLAALAAAK